MIYNESTLRNLGTLNGADHTFAKQMCSTDASGLRDIIEKITAVCGEELRERISEKLLSLDNCAFFQGLAEVITIDKLIKADWKVDGLNWPGPTIKVTDPNGIQYKVPVAQGSHEKGEGERGELP